MGHFRKHNKFLVDFLIIPLVFFTGAYFIFSKSLRANFFLDDINYLIGLKDLVDSQGNYLSFIQTYAMRPIAFKPMSLGVDWIINYKLFGLHPHNYHLFNIVMHAINSFLLYLLVKLSFKLRFLGFVISFCYLIHPFNLEGMVWISGGFTSQNVVLFSCLTLIMYQLYLNKLKKSFLVLSYFSFCCAFLSREDVIMLPFLLAFFLFFIGRLHKDRLKEIFVYFVIVLFVMAARHLLLYPNVYELYRWDFTNIQNALLRNKYYFNLALSPLMNLLGRAVFLEKYKILLTLFKVCLYLFAVPFVVYKIYKFRQTKEAKLLGFGLAWYCLFSVPFNFMLGQAFRSDRYLSLSIIGILMVQVTALEIILRAILKGDIYRKFLLSCFSFALLLICNYMITDGFSNNYWMQHSVNTQRYIASINIALKNNPSIKNIKLAGFPESTLFSDLLRLYPDYKDIKFTDIDNEEKSATDKESTLTIKFIKPQQR